MSEQIKPILFIKFPSITEAKLYEIHGRLLRHTLAVDYHILLVIANVESIVAEILTINEMSEDKKNEVLAAVDVMMKKLTEKPLEEDKLLGLVVFYEPNHDNNTIKEIGRTDILPYSDAIYAYAETPNPASQMVKGYTVEEINSELEKLEQLIKDPKWLEALFESI